MRRSTRYALVAALCCAATLAGSSSAEAAGHIVNVGQTIAEGGYIKGSGSYSNHDGFYVKICVRLMITYGVGPVTGTQESSKQCEAASNYTGYFSAQPVPINCDLFRNELIEGFFTEVDGIAANGYTDRAYSNNLAVLEFC